MQERQKYPIILAIQIMLGASIVLAQESNQRGAIKNEEVRKMGDFGTNGQEVISIVKSRGKEVAYPDIKPGPLVKFEDALERAAERNLTLKVAEMEIDKAESDLKRSWGMLLPIAQGDVEYTHFDHEDSSDLVGSLAPLLGLSPEQIDEMNIGPLVTNPQEKVVVTIDAQIPIVKMEGWFTVRASQKAVDAANLSVEELKRKIILIAAQAWFMAISYKDLIDFTHSQVVTCIEQLRITDANFRVGDRLRLDVVRAEADLAKVKQAMVSAVLSYERARDTLGNLIGMKNALPVPVDSDQRSLGEPPGELSKTTAAQRIEIKKQKAKITAMEKMLTATWMKFVPTLSAGGHFGFRFSEMPDMGSEDRSRWAVVLTLSMPIYNHFKYGELDKRRAELKQAELELEKIREDSDLEIRNAMNAYETSLTTIDLARTQVRQTSGRWNHSNV